MSVFLGLIYLGVADEDFSIQSNLQSAFGGLVMVALANMVSTALPSLVQFPEERPVFLREYSTNHYSVAAYFVSRLTMETVVTGAQVMLSSIFSYFMISYSGNFWLYFLSLYLMAMTSTALGVMAACSVEDPGVAMEFMPAIILPQIIFAGFVITPSLIPVWLRWIRYLFPLTYVIRILLVDNFSDCPTDPTTGINQCEILLDKSDADPDETWWNWLVVILLFIVFRLLALKNLRNKATKFY
jgi:ABC-type multidrug transport system permease subunit